MQKPEKIVVNEHEAAYMLGLSTKTLQARRYRHLPPRYYKVGRSIRYKLDDLMEWIENGKVETRG